MPYLRSKKLQKTEITFLVTLIIARSIIFLYKFKKVLIITSIPNIFLWGTYILRLFLTVVQTLLEEYFSISIHTYVNLCSSVKILHGKYYMTKKDMINGLNYIFWNYSKNGKRILSCLLWVFVKAWALLAELNSTTADLFSLCKKLDRSSSSHCAKKFGLRIVVFINTVASGPHKWTIE